MCRIKIKTLIKQNLSSFPPPIQPPPPTNHHHTLHFARNIVVLLGIVVFLCVLLHFLVRYLIKKKKRSSFSSPPNSLHQSSRFQENTHNDNDDDVVYERQLQQLFNLHDSGLDQAFIDALPVFLYKELMGLKEPFDCAVCLCEFSQLDNLRLLPLCSHAFHIHCIDTWLLSNSTCPLCRGTLFTPGFSVENPIFNFHFDDSIEEEDGVSCNLKQSLGGFEKRVFPVRLGKFRATNCEKKEEKEMGETSSSNLNARRCYSMGSYEYVVGNSELQVRFCPNSSSGRGNIGKKEVGIEKDKEKSLVDGGIDGKKISSRSKGESFSVSKIWLWSKKDQHKFQDSSSGISTTTHMNMMNMMNMMNSHVNVSLPSRNSIISK